MRSILRLSLLAALAACATAAPAPVADARTAILAVSAEFSSLYERGDAAGMVALYTADGVILPPGRPAIQGAEGLTRYWTLPAGVRVLEHRATPDSIAVVGPVAYDWGKYRVRTRNAAGEERETLGKYVIVWREVTPGVWRMHVDMWNSSPPAN